MIYDSFKYKRNKSFSFLPAYAELLTYLSQLNELVLCPAKLPQNSRIQSWPSLSLPTQRKIFTHRAEEWDDLCSNERHHPESSAHAHAYTYTSRHHLLHSCSKIPFSDIQETMKGISSQTSSSVKIIYETW